MTDTGAHAADGAGGEAATLKGPPRGCTLQEHLTENPRFSASESQVAWDTEPNPLPWSDVPGIPCNGDLARADRPEISIPMSRIGLDGILSLSAHAASHAINPRQL